MNNEGDKGILEKGSIAKSKCLLCMSYVAVCVRVRVDTQVPWQWFLISLGHKRLRRHPIDRVRRQYCGLRFSLSLEPFVVFCLRRAQATMVDRRWQLAAWKCERGKVFMLRLSSRTETVYRCARPFRFLTNCCDWKWFAVFLVLLLFLVRWKTGAILNFIGEPQKEKKSILPFLGVYSNSFRI